MLNVYPLLFISKKYYRKKKNCAWLLFSNASKMLNFDSIDHMLLFKTSHCHRQQFPIIVSDWFSAISFSLLLNGYVRAEFSIVLSAPSANTFASL